jgi:hypothetical protein
MRLKQHINENSELDKLVDALHGVINNCQPFLKELGTVNPPQFLYSGRKSNDSWFEKDVRSDRKPTDLFPEIHKDFDDAFNERFGWRARSNGLFCTGYMHDAEEYGAVYVIFPKGPFKVIWSDNIGDLYIKLQDTVSDILGGVKRVNGLKKSFTQEFEYANTLNGYQWSPEQIQDKVHDRYEKFIDDIVDQYRGNNIMKAITSNVEIMLNCKSYYAIRWHLYHNELRDFFKLYDNKYNLTKDQIRSIIVNGEY